MGTEAWMAFNRPLTCHLLPRGYPRGDALCSWTGILFFYFSCGLTSPVQCVHASWPNPFTRRINFSPFPLTGRHVLSNTRSSCPEHLARRLEPSISQKNTLLAHAGKVCSDWRIPCFRSKFGFVFISHHCGINTPATLRCTFTDLWHWLLGFNTCTLHNLLCKCRVAQSWTSGCAPILRLRTLLHTVELWLFLSYQSAGQPAAERNEMVP